MTIYKVTRADVNIGGEMHEAEIVDVKELKNGRHTLENNGLQVPVSVKGNEVTVHVAEAKGNLRTGYVADMGDDWTFEDKGDLKKIVIEPAEGESAMAIHGSQSLLLERHGKKPEIFEIGRRK
jgi:hypothetical protein